MRILACVANGIRERVSERRSRHIPSRSPQGNLRSGEAASELPACHISYGFCLPPTSKAETHDTTNRCDTSRRQVPSSAPMLRQVAAIRHLFGARDRFSKRGYVNYLNFVAATCRRCVHTLRQGCLRLFCRCDMSHEFKPVWIRASDRSDKILSQQQWFSHVTRGELGGEEKGKGKKTSARSAWLARGVMGEAIHNITEHGARRRSRN